MSRTSWNDVNNPFLTPCRLTLCRLFDCLLFYPMLLDPRSFDPMSVKRVLLYYLRVRSRTFLSRNILCRKLSDLPAITRCRCSRTILLILPTYRNVLFTSTLQNLYLINNVKNSIIIAAGKVLNSGKFLHCFQSKMRKSIYNSHLIMNIALTLFFTNDRYFDTMGPVQLWIRKTTFWL